MKEVVMQIMMQFVPVLKKIPLFGRTDKTFVFSFTDRFNNLDISSEDNKIYLLKATAKNSRWFRNAQEMFNRN